MFLYEVFILKTIERAIRSLWFSIITVFRPAINRGKFFHDYMAWIDMNLNKHHD